MDSGIKRNCMKTIVQEWIGGTDLILTLPIWKKNIRGFWMLTKNFDRV